jgi:hypothetical protein
LVKTPGPGKKRLTPVEEFSYKSHTSQFVNLLSL